PSADYAWGGAVVSDNGSTRDPVPSSASETVIAAVADPLPVNSSSKFNLAAVTPDDLFTTVTCNSEDPSSSRLPADDVVDSMAIMLLGQSEDGQHSPLTSEGLLGTAADGGRGDRHLRALDLVNATPNQIHVDAAGPADYT